MDWHPGISMHRLQVGAGFVGALVAVGTLTMFVVGVPAARSFLYSIPVAGLIALGLHYWHQRRKVDLILLGDEDRLHRD
jgi:hypothetical protein